MKLRIYLQSPALGAISRIANSAASRPFEGAVMVEAIVDPIPGAAWLLFDTRQSMVGTGNVAVVVAADVGEIKWMDSDPSGRHLAHPVASVATWPEGERCVLSVDCFDGARLHVTAREFGLVLGRSPLSDSPPDLSERPFDHRDDWPDWESEFEPIVG